MQSSAESLLPREFPGGRLRRLRATDLAAFQAYRRLPELGRYQSWSPLSDPEARAFLTEMNEVPLFPPGQWVQLGIAEPESDHLIGDIGICLSDDGRRSEIGFTLEPGAQSRGIATAAVREVWHILLANTKTQQVLAITDSRNVASIRLLERVGFKLQEIREVTFRGEPCSEKVYALSRDCASSRSLNVVPVIHEFCRALDRRDWGSLRACLAATLWTDYSSFRGTPPARITAEEFIRLRQTGLAGLITQHLGSNHRVTFTGEEAHCCFDFVIRRWPESPDDARSLHTFGYYEMVLHRGADGDRPWVINSITQHALRSEGSRELHGAFRTIDPPKAQP